MKSFVHDGVSTHWQHTGIGGGDVSASTFCSGDSLLSCYSPRSSHWWSMTSHSSAIRRPALICAVQPGHPSCAGGSPVVTCRVCSHALDSAAVIVVQLFHTTCSGAKFSAVVVSNGCRHQNAASSECEIVIFF